LPKTVKLSARERALAALKQSAAEEVKILAERRPKYDK